ncbi:MAG TPA: COQ9 family protein [Caulobacteraceae bacterium]|jgi:ubiquinone biosynthesis protein COQ9
MSALETDWADEAELRVLEAAIGLAPTLGWNSRLVARAGAAAGLSAGETLLLMPDGARDLAALFSRSHDRAALATLGQYDPKALKMRERISRGVEARLDAAAADGEALRRWAGFLTLPSNLPLALKLVWESADVIWRWAGDRATDENHYSKRAILSAILVSTLALRLNAGPEAASAHLATQIGRVMAYETWKAKIHPAALATQLATALGRLRYGR